MTPPSNAGGEGREVLAREVLMRVLPDSMAFAPIGSPAGTAYAIAAMLAFSALENADDRAPALVEAAVAEMRERAECRHHVHVDDSLAFADQVSDQHRLRANAAEARLRLIVDTLIDKGESWQSYSGRLRAIAWVNKE